MLFHCEKLEKLIEFTLQKHIFSHFSNLFLSNLKKIYMTLINNIINDNPIHHRIEPFISCTHLHRLSSHNIPSTHMQNGGFHIDSTWTPFFSTS